MQIIIELINNIPSGAWVAFVTAILTSGLTLTGVWLTNNNNNQRLRIQLEHDKKIREEEIIRERLEELYVIANKYLGTLVGHYLPFRMVMYGELTFNQALDINIEMGSKTDYESHRVEMLIELYFPDIKPEFNRMMEIREKLNDLVDSYKQQYKTGNTDGSRWLAVFQPLLEQLGKLSEEFKGHIVNLKK